jgi:lipopolysaccharide export system protein LptA
VRLEYFLAKYPDAKGIDKALLYLVQSYRELGNQAKSDMYLDRLRAEYPNSLYARTTIRERKTLQTAKAGAAKTAPQMPVYEEKKKRNIDLTVPRTAPAAKTDGTATIVAPKDQASVKESGKDAGKTGGKPAEEMTEETADGNKEIAKDKKKEDDKNKLGFFDKKKPVDIVSDTMEGFDKEKYVLFKGSVIAKQEDLYIFADTIEAYMSGDTNEIEKAVAKGNVKIVKQERTATCREALFENAKGEITLKGNVIVYQGQDKLSGDTIIYFVNEDRVVVQAEKDKRAHITVQPK